MEQHSSGQELSLSRSGRAQSEGNEPTSATPGSSASALLEFNKNGFLGPVPLLTRRECRSLMSHIESSKFAAANGKSSAVTDWLLFRVAANPQLIEIVKLILGEAIVLWGCSVVRRRPGEVHPWHVDIETSTQGGRYLTAWIGLENTRRNGSLELIAGSHVGTKVIQQIQWEHGYRRGEAPTETILRWAREQNAEAALIKPELDDGEALLFHGQLWHASRNVSRSGTRTALLLQFAAADSPVRMQHETEFEWPFRPGPKPPALVVNGEVTDEETNRLVSPPIPNHAKGGPMLSTRVISLNLPLDEEPRGGWKPYQLFGGATPILDHMNCHVSVLSKGCSPHPPHAHHEEEILIVLDGEAELIIGDGRSPEGTRVERVEPGTFAYYPASQHHTIQNPGSVPLTYLMFKWHVDGAKAPTDPIGASIFRASGESLKGSDGWVTETVMNGTTGLLGLLHCHMSYLAPGASYAPHVDAYDVAILTLSGCVETLGERVPPYSVIYYAAGQKHGMRNPGEEPARYLVFEFHPSTIDLGRRVKRRLARVAKHALKRSALAVGVDLGRLRGRISHNV